MANTTCISNLLRQVSRSSSKKNIDLKDPEALALGKKFNDSDSVEFIGLLRKKVKENPNVRFNIIADWKSLEKARAAKGILDSGRYPIDTFAIKATKEQYMEDVNAFQSGVEWIEI